MRNIILIIFSLFIIVRVSAQSGTADYQIKGRAPWDQEKVLIQGIDPLDVKHYKQGKWARLDSLIDNTSCISVDTIMINDGDSLVIAFCSGDTIYFSSGSDTPDQDTISSLFGANKVNIIDNFNFRQTWKWNTLAGNSGLFISDSTTAAASNLQKALEIKLFGANANTGQTTYGLYVDNSHTGTAPINYGIYGNGGAFGVYGNAATTGAGVRGVSSSGSGTQGISTSGNGMFAQSTSGTGLFAQTNTGTAAIIGQLNQTTTNDTKTIARLIRGTSGTAAAGIGGSLDFLLHTTTGAQALSNSLKSSFTTATNGAQVSKFILSGINAATEQDLLTLAGSGQLTLNQYTTGNFEGGVAADSALVVTSAGVVKKRNASALGTIDYDWLEVTSGTPPDNINDNMYSGTGNHGIGYKTNPDNLLELSTNSATGAFQSFETTSTNTSAVLGRIQFDQGANSALGEMWVQKQSTGTNDAQMVFQMKDDGGSFARAMKFDQQTTTVNKPRVMLYGGLQNRNWRNVSTNTSLDLGDYGIRATASGITITLPLVTTTNGDGIGTMVIIYNASTGNIDVDPGTVSDAINGRPGNTNYTVPARKAKLFIASFIDGFNDADWTMIDDDDILGSDSIIIHNDSLCLISMGDTICVSQDSFFYSGDTSLCVITMGDTLCTPYTSNVGINFYNSDGSFTGNRTGEMGTYFVRFTRGGQTRFGMFADGGAYNSLFQIQDTVATHAITRFHNSSANDSANAFIVLSAQSSPYRYSIGVDKSKSAFVLSEDLDLNDPAWLYYQESDSMVVKKDIQIDSGLIDNAGNYGTTGQIATSTGTGWLWDDADMSGSQNIYNHSDTIHDGATYVGVERRVHVPDSTYIVLIPTYDSTRAYIDFRGRFDNNPYSEPMPEDPDASTFDYRLGTKYTAGHDDEVDLFVLSSVDPLTQTEQDCIQFNGGGLQKLYTGSATGRIDGQVNKQLNTENITGSYIPSWQYQNHMNIIDTVTTASHLTLAPGHYSGVNLTNTGFKFVHLPDATSTTQGLWFSIFNTAASGDIGVDITTGSGDTIFGNNVIHPNESATFINNTTDTWTQN